MEHPLFVNFYPLFFSSFVHLSLSLSRALGHTYTHSLSLSICLAIIRKKEDGRVSRSKSSSVRLPRGLLCVHSAPNCLLFPNSIKMGEFSDSLRERDSSCIISRVKESGGGKKCAFATRANFEIFERAEDQERNGAQRYYAA